MAKDEERERRLAEALRANLRRRKQQQRSADQSGPAALERDGGTGASGEEPV